MNISSLVDEPQCGKYRVVNRIETLLIHGLRNRHFEYICCVQRGEPVKVVSKTADHLAPDCRARTKSCMCRQGQRSDGLRLIGRETVTARVDGATLILSSPVDPHFGIRTERRSTLSRQRLAA